VTPALRAAILRAAELLPTGPRDELDARERDRLITTLRRAAETDKGENQ